MVDKLVASQTRLYYSREDRIAQLNDAKERLEYKNLEADAEKSDLCMDAVADFVDDLEIAQESYAACLAEPGSNDEEMDLEAVAYHRAEMVHAWAMAQAALSKFAWVHRIDGNKAYERLIEALKVDGTTDMRGL